VKKFLREILCVMRGVSAATGIGIDGIPVGPAQLFQGGARLCAVQIRKVERRIGALPAIGESSS